MPKERNISRTNNSHHCWSLRVMMQQDTNVYVILVNGVTARPVTRILFGGGANEAKVDQTSEMYFLFNSF